MLVEIEPSPDEVDRAEEQELGADDGPTKIPKPLATAARIRSAAAITETTAKVTAVIDPGSHGSALPGSAVMNLR